MERRTKGTRLEVAECQRVMEGSDVQALVLTLAAGQSVPWHYHSEITDVFFCLTGSMVVETLAPHAMNVLEAGESCSVPPKTAHCIYGKDNGPCRFLVLEGVGVYDSVPVGSSYSYPHVS